MVSIFSAVQARKIARAGREVGNERAMAGEGTGLLHADDFPLPREKQFDAFGERRPNAQAPAVLALRWSYPNVVFHPAKSLLISILSANRRSGNEGCTSVAQRPSASSGALPDGGFRLRSCASEPLCSVRSGFTRGNPHQNNDTQK